MLAFNCCNILEKLPLKIEALDTWGERLVVATTEGSLLIYDVKEKEDGQNPFHVSLSAESQKQFLKKPIQQIDVVERNNVIVSLSDGLIYVHDLPSFNLRNVVKNCKNCHLYALDSTKIPLALCACIKKKLVIFQWDGNEFVEIKQLEIPDQAKSVVWADQSLCVGYRKEYNLINIQTGAITELFSTGKLANPIANRLLGQDQLLLEQDSRSILVGFDGKPARKYGLSWSEPPAILGYSFPFVIAITSKGAEIQMVPPPSSNRPQGNRQPLVQHIAIIKQGKAICDKRDIYVGSISHVWRLIPVPLATQIDNLVSERLYEEALLLCENLPDSLQKNEKTRWVKVLHAYHLFKEGHYERSMSYFSELEVDPLQVIGLYPNLLPRDIRSKNSYPIDVPDLVGVPLEKALQALIVFLTRLRSSGTHSLPSSTPEEYTAVTDIPTIIDTSLLKAYIKTNDHLLAPLLRLPNHCHVRECQKVLMDYKKYHELVLLYKCKGMHKDALELLARLGQNPVGTPLGGTQETISYLKSLGKQHISLIQEFSRWVLQVNPDEALTIFTEDRPLNERLPSDIVLQHLKLNASQLVVSFLEFIIKDPSVLEKGAEFHNDLIFQYLETIIALQRDSVYQDQKRAYLISLSTPNPIQLPIAGTEPGLLGATRKKLLTFLEQSQYYNPERMLSRFPFDDLYEERAILLSRIGQHEQALSLYAHKLKNFDMAEEYCNRHYSQDKEDSRDVYLALLRVYLGSPEPMIQPAMALLSKHYQRIDTPKALSLLPPHIPIAKLHPFFEAVLRDTTKVRRNNQVVKNLLKSENLQIREQLIGARSRVVKVTDDRMCPVCNRRLGSSVFACYPNGTVVHFMCLQNQQAQEKGTQKKPTLTPQY